MALKFVRAPGLELGDDDQEFDGFDLLPRATWLGQTFANSRTPASSLGRGLLVSWIPEVPRYRLTICPHWLQKLGWHPHPSNELVFLDTGCALVAKIVWWRDGGPVDIDDDVIWGQGAYISLTPVGRQQIEVLMGPLDVRVHVRRSYRPGSKEGAKKFKLSSARE